MDWTEIDDGFGDTSNITPDFFSDDATTELKYDKPVTKVMFKEAVKYDCYRDLLDVELIKIDNKNVEKYLKSKQKNGAEFEYESDSEYESESESESDSELKPQKVDEFIEISNKIYSIDHAHKDLKRYLKFLKKSYILISSAHLVTNEIKIHGINALIECLELEKNLTLCFILTYKRISRAFEYKYFPTKGIEEIQLYNGILPLYELTSHYLSKANYYEINYGGNDEEIIDELCNNIIKEQQLYVSDSSTNSYHTASEIDGEFYVDDDKRILENTQLLKNIKEKYELSDNSLNKSPDKLSDDLLEIDNGNLINKDDIKSIINTYHS